MPLDPKAITPRDVRASGVLKFVETTASPGESQARIKEVSSIQAQRAEEMKAKAEAAKRNRQRKRQERQWCASPRREDRADASRDGGSQLV